MATLVGVRRQKDVSDSIIAVLRELDALRGEHRSEKLVRHLHQNARAVTGQRVAAASATMSEIDEDFQTLADNFVRFFPMHVHDEAHAAGIVFERRVVETFALARVEWKLRLHGDYRFQRFTMYCVCCCRRQGPMLGPAWLLPSH